MKYLTILLEKMLLHYYKYPKKMESAFGKDFHDMFLKCLANLDLPYKMRSAKYNYLNHASYKIRSSSKIGYFTIISRDSGSQDEKVSVQYQTDGDSSSYIDIIADLITYNRNQPTISMKDVAFHRIGSDQSTISMKDVAFHIKKNL